MSVDYNAVVSAVEVFGHGTLGAFEIGDIGLDTHRGVERIVGDGKANHVRLLRMNR
uniref:hypothetical protein n=1 Tax=unclassified Rhodococcus (in: high G+C Gram-positive bacteria) TaxID=192944 RepID=UPI0020CFE00B|nr:MULTISPECIES: hypothetical protein [unclassified Rhodococcus (in: high G+C Gram-positive bacteria)]